MFLVGLEIDLSQLKGRIAQAAAISNTSVALPMMLGIAVALPLYPLVGPDKDFTAFALLMGVAMSITAFPVLARILVERRMLKRPVGALTRPLLARVSKAYDEAGRVPGAWVAAIFAGVLLSAFVTEEIGIAVIFGGFIAGMIMPRHAG